MGIASHILIRRPFSAGLGWLDSAEETEAQSSTCKCIRRRSKTKETQENKSHHSTLGTSCANQTTTTSEKYPKRSDGRNPSRKNTRDYADSGRRESRSRRITDPRNPTKKNSCIEKRKSGKNLRGKRGCECH